MVHRIAKKMTKRKKPIVMIGCSKSHKHNKNCVNSGCSNCGPNCHCGPNCNCSHNCPGNCYLNRRKKRGGGCGLSTCSVGGGCGCGSSSCPVGGYTVGGFTVGGYTYNKNKHSKTYKRRSHKNKTASKKSRTSQYGGSIFPTDLTNLMRSFTYNFNAASNALYGYKAPTNPLPYVDQLRQPLKNGI